MIHQRASEIADTPDSMERGRQICDLLKSVDRTINVDSPWQSVTYSFLSKNLRDYTDTEENSIRYFCWLALHWKQLYEIRQVPEERFSIKYLRVPDIYGKFLCDLPDLVFTGDVEVDPFRSNKKVPDTNGYKPTFKESYYPFENTVPFWYDDVWNTFKNKDDWQYPCILDIDPYQGCFDFSFTIHDPEVIKQRDMKAQKKYRTSLFNRELGDD